MNQVIKNKVRCPACNSTDIVRMRYEPKTRILHYVCCNENCTQKGIKKMKLEENQ